MLKTVLCTLFLTSFSIRFAAQTPSAITLAHLVDTHYNHLSSLRTRYTERYQGMGMDRTESGTLTLRKPGRMRWAYDAPTGKLFILNAKEAISYTPGDPQAERLPAKEIDDLRSPLRFLLGHTELTKELDHLTAAPVEGGYTLSGTPHSPTPGSAQNLRTILLTINPKGIIQSLRIEESDGAVTTFAFNNMQENVPALDSDFSFTPPPGVTIINGTAPI